MLYLKTSAIVISTVFASRPGHLRRDLGVRSANGETSSSYVPKTNSVIIPLYNPEIDAWKDHFATAGSQVPNPRLPLDPAQIVFESTFPVPDGTLNEGSTIVTPNLGELLIMNEIHSAGISSIKVVKDRNGQQYILKIEYEVSQDSEEDEEETDDVSHDGLDDGEEKSSTTSATVSTKPIAVPSYMAQFFNPRADDDMFQFTQESDSENESEPDDDEDEDVDEDDEQDENDEEEIGDEEEGDVQEDEVSVATVVTPFEDIDNEMGFFRAVEGQIATQAIGTVYFMTSEMQVDGSKGNCKYIVLEKLDRSIEDLAQVGVTMLKKIARKGISVLEKIHQSGFIHGDVHAGNFMLTGTQLKAIDFGRVAKYMDENDQHVAARPNPIGENDDLRNMSISELEERTESRRDDMFRFGEALLKKVCFRKYMAATSTSAHNPQAMREFKMTYIPSQICGEEYTFFDQYLDMVRALNYEDEPVYAALSLIFA